MIKFLLKKKLYRSFIRKLDCFLHSRFWLNVCFFSGQTLSVRVKINRKLNLFFKISPDQVFWRILNSHHWINSRSNPRVSIRGVKSLWVDRRFMPADQGSYWVICAICSFWRLFTIFMIKSVEVFPFSFWKIHFFFTS